VPFGTDVVYKLQTTLLNCADYTASVPSPCGIDILYLLQAVLLLCANSSSLWVCFLQAILLNCADYTAWEYRWLCLVELNKEDLIHDEVAFLGRIAAASPKNYQLWNHRRKVALRRGEAFALEVRRCFRPKRRQKGNALF
jgi:hypothetical protein